MKTSIPQPCAEWAAQIAAAQRDDLTPEEHSALEAHIASCENCRAAQDRYAQMDAAIARLPAPGPLPGLPTALLAQWQAEDRQGQRASVRRFPRGPEQSRPISEAPARPNLPSLPSGALRRPTRRVASILTAAAAVLMIAVLTTALIASRLHFNTTPTGHPSPQPSIGLTGVPTLSTADTDATHAAQQTPSPSPTSKTFPVLVYFSHHPESDNDPTAVFPVQRVSPDAGVATFALKQLFLGPTPDEQAQGYYSEFAGNFSSPDNCTDPSKDFILTLNYRGTTPEQGTATVMFCRAVLIPGDLSGPRMRMMITKTLMQFSNIQQVVVLNYQGHCFADLRGGDSCLQG